ncbi:type 1 glutamine amidotransferase [Halalkalicoccus tibetensis]|uniref:Type 1 glutamine amidotransferase n=1 Tax=Halalkalicoccus tibetensis TaxID=175632 RepID=A0ABD5V6W3_9EURY
MILVVHNEPDPGSRYHTEELARQFPDRREHDFASEGSPPDLGDVDGVVLAGSTAGVYEADEHPWMAEQAEWIRDLVGEGVPTLGVCFGHQAINGALGGRVEHRGLRCALVEPEFDDSPLFDGVGPGVAAVHGDWVVEAGEGMEPIASLPNYPLFATRHRWAPVWSVQFHPECTERFYRVAGEKHGWEPHEESVEAFAATELFGNFRRLAEDRR